MRRKMLLIANPIAGIKRIKRMLPRLEKYFYSNGFDVEIFETSAKGDGAAAAEKYSGDFDIIVCAGGDGTLNETISGVLYSGVDTPIGYIPAGSTNDFAAGLGLPVLIMKAAENIVKGTPRELDVGKINERYFSYVASFGAFTETSYSVPQSLKNTLGHLAYILEGVKDIPNIRPRHMRIEAGGGVYEDDYLFGAISNSTSLGGILKLNAGLVDFSDGLFEVMLIKNPQNAVELSKIVLSLQAKRYDEEVITFFQSSDVTIISDEDTPWSLDGEYYEGCDKISVSNIHQAIRFVTQ